MTNLNLSTIIGQPGVIVGLFGLACCVAWADLEFLGWPHIAGVTGADHQAGLVCFLCTQHQLRGSAPLLA